MRAFAVSVATVLLAMTASASWYWPFGSDDEVDEERPLRISELMRPATALIDEASDFAEEGKLNESIATNRLALAELDRIERENPERAQKPEFATLRNKRAYVNAAIDAMLLAQIKDNARAVAISDTTELERRLAEEKSGKKQEPASPKNGESDSSSLQEEVEPSAKASEPAAPLPPPKTKREAAMRAIASDDFAAAERLIGELLAEKPNSAAGLNLKAALEVRQGKLKEAEATLDQAIMSNPRNHFAYYNMAKLMLQARPDAKAVARRYYETGRAVGGPADEKLEVAFR